MAEGGSIKPGHCPDGRAVTIVKLQGETAEPEQIITASVQILQVFDIDDFLFPEESAVAGQILHGVNADGIHADALIIAGEDVIQNLVIHAGEITEVGIGAPVPVPAQIEQEKICLPGFFAVFADMGHGDGVPFLQIPAVDDQCFSDELVRRELIQGGSAGKNMGGGIHVGTGVGIHGHFGFLEKVFFVGICGFQPGCFRAGVDGHGLFDGVGQVDDGHRITFFQYIFVIIPQKKKKGQKFCPFGLFNGRVKILPLQFPQNAFGEDFADGVHGVDAVIFDPLQDNGMNAV